MDFFLNWIVIKIQRKQMTGVRNDCRKILNAPTIKMHKFPQCIEIPVGLEFIQSHVLAISDLGQKYDVTIQSLYGNEKSIQVSKKGTPKLTRSMLN